VTYKYALKHLTSEHVNLKEVHTVQDQSYFESVSGCAFQKMFIYTTSKNH